MNVTEFQRAVALLRERGESIRSQEYREREFGSWYVVVSVKPARRLVWDGKDGWYVVEEETSERFNGLPVWRDLWIDRHPKIQSLEKAVDALLSRRP
jgi:hypothetical protein